MKFSDKFHTLGDFLKLKIIENEMINEILINSVIFWRKYSKYTERLFGKNEFLVLIFV